MVEPSARFEEIKIPLADPIHGLEAVSAVLGIPRWWPTGARVAVVFAHGANADMEDSAIQALHRELTERRYLSLRFNFPFAEAGKRRPDSMPMLRRTLRNAIALLARDPTAAPAHLFLVGKGLGAQIAADLSISRVRADGLILMAYPLHPGSKPEEIQADQIYRVVAPLLFVQGTRDRYCDIETLRRTLTRVGAPTRLQVVDNADQNFKVLKKSGRTAEQVNQQILSASDAWIEHVLDGA